ncbi:uncharacterized protein LOC114365853 [Ostrinia furnacalis]|uniref:uncharacterized protein LOC114365853 n=1 Tax=Ostrinia furnacalis TaxID=93504 RepID=UPI00103C184D|nr:uncharacterized protein LOC114365853 [Ostrinia furnacalis]
MAKSSSPTPSARSEAGYSGVARKPRRCRPRCCTKEACRRFWCDKVCCKRCRCFKICGRRIKRKWRRYWAERHCYIPKRVRRKCKDFLLCQCCCCACCYTLTDEEYDKITQPPPKKYPPPPAPKITRREEHVEYIKKRSSRSPKRKFDKNIKSNENETEVYFCTVKPPSFNSNSLKLHPPVMPAEFNATGNKEKGGKDSNRLRPKVASSKREKHTPKLYFQHKSSVARNICDFSCQNNSQSNQSLELKSHTLSKSISQHSSVQSVFSIKWRRRFRRYEKAPSTLQTILYSLARKFKSNKKKTKSAQKHDKKNVLVLHVPKKFSNTSIVGTVSATRSSRAEKPLIIRDESSQALPIEHSKPPNKICGPGEVLVKRNSFQNVR